MKKLLLIALIVLIPTISFGGEEEVIYSKPVYKAITQNGRVTSIEDVIVEESVTITKSRVWTLGEIRDMIYYFNSKKESVEEQIEFWKKAYDAAEKEAKKVRLQIEGETNL